MSVDVVVDGRSIVVVGDVVIDGADIYDLGVTAERDVVVDRYGGWSALGRGARTTGRASLLFAQLCPEEQMMNGDEPRLLEYAEALATWRIGAPSCLTEIDDVEIMGCRADGDGICAVDDESAQFFTIYKRWKGAAVALVDVPSRACAERIVGLWLAMLLTNR